MLMWSLGLGGLRGALLLAIDLVLVADVPSLVDLARTTSLWENFTASLYDGTNEQILLRLLSFPGFVWLLPRVGHTAPRTPTNSTLWAANVITAIAFGPGHLPAVLAITGRIRPPLLGRTLVLNAPTALICGCVYW
jgi:hypothetical protein